MKRIILLVTVALVMALAGPASATIHPLSCSERSQAPEGTTAQTQDPPGLTGGDQATEAQPVLVANPNAFKAEGC